MPWTIRTIWYFYFLSFGLMIGRESCAFFTPGSRIYQYFFYLRQFDQSFIFDYLLNTTQVVLNLIMLLPILLYTHRLKLLSAKFWQYLLILRFIFDICGHPFALHNLTALHHSNPKIAILVYAQILLFRLPSYAACYFYAFQYKTIWQQKLSPASS
ncbi:MAG: hypothetical protein KC618_05820 [Candidatus Omnitrophica bacterium]|nr:hypothetical protein [Candidatus Omnitrophota bacterium]